MHRGGCGICPEDRLLLTLDTVEAVCHIYVQCQHIDVTSQVSLKPARLQF